MQQLKASKMWAIVGRAALSQEYTNCTVNTVIKFSRQNNIARWNIILKKKKKKEHPALPSFSSPTQACMHAHCLQSFDSLSFRKYIWHESPYCSPTSVPGLQQVSILESEGLLQGIANSHLLLTVHSSWGSGPFPASFPTLTVSLQTFCLVLPHIYIQQTYRAHTEGGNLCHK